jgi:hypothetical protein
MLQQALSMLFEGRTLYSESGLQPLLGLQQPTPLGLAMLAFQLRGYRRGDMLGWPLAALVLPVQNMEERASAQ